VIHRQRDVKTRIAAVSFWGLIGSVTRDSRPMAESRAERLDIRWR
jgi:hypothetical protein